MTEHEKLKQICDKIWYKYWNFQKWKFMRFWYDNIQESVKEIIFTQEFMDKYFYYYRDKNNYNFTLHWELWTKQLIFRNLNNPVEYLYNLLELWKQDKN